MNETADHLAPMSGQDFEDSGKDLFGVLEQRIEALVDRHREAVANIEDLRAQVVERDRRISELNGQVATLQRVRNEVLRRVEGLITRVDGIERVASTIENGDASIESTGPGATA